MINIIIKHEGINGDLNDNEAFLNEIQRLETNAIGIAKEEYLNDIITFYYQNNELKYVLFTVENTTNNVDGYVIELSNSSLDEVAIYIAGKRNIEKNIILEELL